MPDAQGFVAALAIIVLMTLSNVCDSQVRRGAAQVWGMSAAEYQL